MFEKPSESQIIYVNNVLGALLQGGHLNLVHSNSCFSPNNFKKIFLILCSISSLNFIQVFSNSLSIKNACFRPFLFKNLKKIVYRINFELHQGRWHSFNYVFLDYFNGRFIFLKEFQCDIVSGNPISDKLFNEGLAYLTRDLVQVATLLEKRGLRSVESKDVVPTSTNLKHQD